MTNEKSKIILGIETSCDETAASVVRGNGKNIEVLSNVVSSQVDIHKKFGGVIPEVAAREHVLNMLPVVDEALRVAGVTPPFEGGAGGGLDAIAVTTGPGLITSLLTGVETAKSLSFAWDVPLIGVNHIEGHIYANWILRNRELGIENQGKKNKTNLKFFNFKDIFPALVLTVSGGHTMLVLMKGYGKFKTIGDTLDDAAGEAFDKAAALLGLGYPGGPAIAAKAAEFGIRNLELGNQPPNPPLGKRAKNTPPNSQFPIPNSISLPRPMLDRKDLNFSFSGLKTAILYQVQKDPKYKKRISEYSHEFQQAVIDVLVGKTIKAAQQYTAKTVMLAGGVSANKELRRQFSDAVALKLPDSRLQIPDLQYTTDNAAMIAAAGYFRFQQKKFTPWHKLRVDCNQELR